MTIDILPTLAHLTGASLPRQKIDGRNILPLLTQPGAKSPHEVLYFYWNQELHAVRSGPWKLHLPHNYNALKAAGKDGKPGPYEQKKLPLSLFHLNNDPQEQFNVVEKHPEIVKQLMVHVEVARQDLGDSLTRHKGAGVRDPGKINPGK